MGPYCERIKLRQKNLVLIGQAIEIHQKCCEPRSNIIKEYLFSNGMVNGWNNKLLHTEGTARRFFLVQAGAEKGLSLGEEQAEGPRKQVPENWMWEHTGG